MDPLRPTANHKLLDIEVVFARPPAVIAPMKSARNAAILRFLFGLADQGRVYSFVSTRRSHKRVVRTTVGISSKAKMRDATIWPAAWKARRVIGRICIH
jgi:hypothetical protein